jgi:serine/threonine protein kinase
VDVVDVVDVVAERIIYRDVKLSNLMIDADGYVKLADFSSSRRMAPNERAFSLVGSPHYVAPEIVTREGHSYSCDWWR